jgi:hypothetical protein
MDTKLFEDTETTLAELQRLVREKIGIQEALHYDGYRYAFVLRDSEITSKINSIPLTKYYVVCESKIRTFL